MFGFNFLVVFCIFCCWQTEVASESQETLLQTCNSSLDDLLINITTRSAQALTFRLKYTSLNCSSTNKPPSVIRLYKNWANVTHQVFNQSSTGNYKIFVENEVNDGNSKYLLPNGIYAEKTNSQDTHFYNPEEYCVENIFNSSLELQLCNPDCSSELFPCITKCCPLGYQFDVIEEKCTPSTKEPWKPLLFSNTKDTFPTNRSFKPHYVHKDLNCSLLDDEKHEGKKSTWFSRDFVEKEINPSRREYFKLLLNGSVMYLKRRGRFWRDVYLPNYTCIDGIQNFGNNFEVTGTELNQVLMFCQQLDSPEDIGWRDYYVTASIISAFFLFLTCLVYILLWDKQNVHGWTVFSLTLSMFFMSSSIIIKQIFDPPPVTTNQPTLANVLCITNAIIYHLSWLSTFNWLAVLNFDLFYTFRSISVMSSTSKGHKRYVLYASLAWGTAFVFVFISWCINKYYSNPESFVTVTDYGVYNCGIAKWSVGPYLYYVISFPLIINFPLVFATFYHLCQAKKSSAAIRSTRQEGQLHKFLLMLKLTVLMGVTWTFEVISWAATPDDDYNRWYWVVLDMYNFGKGLVIFIIFICKNSIKNQLSEKYPAVKKLLDWISLKINHRNENSVNLSNTSNNTGTTAVSGNI